jgi:hypothetical protein
MVDDGDHMKIVRGHVAKGKWHDAKLEASQDPTVLVDDGWLLRLESFLGQFWKVVILYQKSNFTSFWYKLILHFLSILHFYRF